MGRDPTRAYFWPAVIRRPTSLWPGYFLTQPEEIFLTRRGSFPNPNLNHRWMTRLNLSHKKLTRHDRGQNILTRTNHYYGQFRSLLPWLRVPCWFFLIQVWNFASGLGIEPSTLDLRSQPGANELSDKATPHKIDLK